MRKINEIFNWIMDQLRAYQSNTAENYIRPGQDKKFYQEACTICEKDNSHPPCTTF